jgi:cell wall assembly regulator SMI1
MQSTRRQIKRGGAVIAFNNVSKSAEIITKKHTSSRMWNGAVKNRMLHAEDEYIGSVTNPLTHEQILNAEKRVVCDIPNKKRKARRHDGQDKKAG